MSTLAEQAGGAKELPVSVVIPAHSRPRELRRAIESVLEQTRPPAEVVVVDDGSPEPLGPAISDLAPQVKVVRAERSRGPGAARNVGAAEASMDWIAFLDDDDVWSPTKLAQQAEGALEGTAVVTNYKLVSSAWTRTVRIHRRALNDPALCSALSPTTVLVLRSDFDRAGGFPTRRDCAEDWVFFARLIATGTSIRCIEEPLAIYNWTAASTTAAHGVRISHIRGAIEEIGADERLSVAHRHAVRANGLRRIAEVEANDGRLFAGLATASRALRYSPAQGTRAVARVPVAFARGMVRRRMRRKQDPEPLGAGE